MMNTPNIFSTELSNQENLDNLHRYGITIVRNFLSKSKISSLLNIHSYVLDETIDFPGRFSLEEHPENKGGMVSRISLNKIDDKYSILHQVFSNPHMTKLAMSYFGSEILLNDSIFFTHEVESDKQILPWHFDRQQSLKFYINLVDVDESNGAFEYDIGSHREGHFRANYYILKGVPIGKIPNDIPDNELRNPTVISAKAGDLVIFDPDGFHRGGIVSPGRERKVVRGHTHPIPNITYTPKPLSKNWWLQTPLNIASWLAPSCSRVLNDGALTGAKNRNEK